MCDGVGFALLRAVDSPLSDGDYRTFVFLCAQAGSSDSEGIFTDKTYDDLASRHPGTSPLTPAALRARIMRLVKAGLVQRERVGRTCWRTRIVTDQAPPDSIEGRRAASVGVASDSTLPLAHAVGETPDHPHLLTEGVGVMGCDTQPTAEESLGAVCYDIHADAGSSTSETLNLAGGPSIVTRATSMLSRDRWPKPPRALTAHTGAQKTDRLAPAGMTGLWVLRRVAPNHLI